jgi:hypothetical protein
VCVSDCLTSTISLVLRRARLAERSSGLRDRAHGVCFESANGALECVAVGVCTAANGIVPLAGRRTTHALGFVFRIPIASTTSCRKGALAAQPTYIHGRQSKARHRARARARAS